MFLMRSPRLPALLALLLLGCADATAPASTSHDVLFAVGGEGSSVFIIDPAAGRVIARPGPLPYYKGNPATLTADSSMLLFGASDPGVAIYAVNKWGTRLDRRLVLEDARGAFQEHDGLWINGTAMAAGPRGRHLYLGPAYTVKPPQPRPADNGRIAVLDLGTMHVTDTIGPFDDLWQMAQLPPGPVAPTGALLVLGARQAQGSTWLFVIDPATHAVVDSGVIMAPGTGRPAELRSMVAAPDGRSVYVQDRYGVLYDYDLVARQVVARAQLLGDQNALALAPDGSRLYAVYPGAPEIFILPSDSIQVFDAQLEPQPGTPLVDQRAPGGGRPFAANAVAMSRDGRWLYLATGVGHLAGPGRMAVVVMDRTTGRVKRVIPLGVFGQVTLYAGH